MIPAGCRPSWRFEPGRPGSSTRTQPPGSTAEPRPLSEDTATERTVISVDGTPIAVFAIAPDASGRSGDMARSGATDGPLLLVHGTTGDHTTFRVVGPRLASFREVHAMDRRGRGLSGDTPPYSIEREFEDVAAVAAALAAEADGPVPVFGHSYGGRCALGAALRTDAIASVICYEGAPAPSGRSYRPDGLEARLRDRVERGDAAGLMALFMSDLVGMTPAELDAYRANPVWPVRVAAAHTIIRELEGEASTPASLEVLGAVRQPVLQLLGSASRPVFREATIALDARLRDGRVVEIDGAGHAAHHTHPDDVVRAVRAFLA